MEPPPPPPPPPPTSPPPATPQFPPSMPPEPVFVKPVVRPMEYFGQAPALSVPPTWTNVEIFALNQDEYRGFIRLLVALRVLYGVVIYVVIALFSFFFGSFGQAEEFWTYCVFLAIVCGTMDVILAFRAVARQKRTWQFYRLVLADQGLIICDPYRPTAQVEREKVSKIVETWDTFKLFIDGKHDIVPKRIVSVEKVRARLTQWQTIEQGKGMVGLVAMLGWSMVLAIATVVLLVFGNATSNRNVLMGCLIAMLLLCLITIFRVFRNRAHSTSTRWSTLLSLLGPLYLAQRWWLWQ